VDIAGNLAILRRLTSWANRMICVSTVNADLHEEERNQRTPTAMKQREPPRPCPHQPREPPFTHGASPEHRRARPARVEAASADGALFRAFVDAIHIVTN